MKNGGVIDKIVEAESLFTSFNLPTPTIVTSQVVTIIAEALSVDLAINLVNIGIGNIIIIDSPLNLESLIYGVIFEKSYTLISGNSRIQNIYEASKIEDISAGSKITGVQSESAIKGINANSRIYYEISNN